jgi:hypothetical protein
VKKFVKSCDVCVLANNPHHRLHGLLQPLPISTSPWFSISMDFITNLPPSSSNDSILVVVDYLMKMVHFIMCIKTITSKGMAKLFFDHVFQYHGLHKNIIYDHCHNPSLELTTKARVCKGAGQV